MDEETDWVFGCPQCGTTYNEFKTAIKCCREFHSLSKTSKINKRYEDNEITTN